MLEIDVSRAFLCQPPCHGCAPSLRYTCTGWRQSLVVLQSVVLQLTSMAERAMVLAMVASQCQGFGQVLPGRLPVHHHGAG